MAQAWRANLPFRSGSSPRGQEAPLRSQQLRSPTRLLPVLAVLVALVTPATADRMEGELIVAVRDPAGLPAAARVDLLSWVSQFRTEQIADDSGTAHFKRLPFGLYRLRVRQAGFDTVSMEAAIPSEIPVRKTVVLLVADVEASITVEESPPLLDPWETRIILPVGRRRMDEQPFTTVGRGMIEAVNELPGWLLEANAVPHPRGSEYDTQYVIDGIPIYDNRSIGFVPAFEVDEFEAAHVMTGNLPAEFGRRLGGVIELHSRRSDQVGHHPEFSIQAGSFDTISGAFSHLYSRNGTSFSLGLRAGHTNRYLDPPSFENFTNKSTSSGVNGRFERDFTQQDRLSLSFRSNRVGFLVPNDLAQQAAGQRQDRRGAETAGQIHYQHVFSARTLGSVRGMFRDVSAELWSNPLSTPVFVEQARAIRQGVISGALAVQGEHHTLKLGGDVRVTRLTEDFLFAESNRLPAIDFLFNDSKRGTDVGFFVQERLRVGDLVLDAGLRFDHHRLLINDSALSPRVGLSYYWRDADLLFRGSYDRIFQIPPFENLLLSSLLRPRNLDSLRGALPVPAGTANFYEVGVRKPLFDRFRLDVSHYWRDFENFYDDDVFLNTGVSFPISFDSARVEGTEARLELPQWRGITSFVSYTNMLGTANSPVTGGLFIRGGEAEELRDVATVFPITQDQRNTLVSMVRFEPHSRVWVSVRARYGSGLPVELVGTEEEEGKVKVVGTANEDPFEGIPVAILDKVDIERGRLKPNFNLDFSVGARIWREDRKSLTLQVDIVNATDRLNVINFTGLFSGTALAPGRMVGVKLRARL